jgi:hypothetical protein
VYLLLFSLLTVVGAWSAWRRNPMYSGWKTLRSIVVVGLAVAAVVGAVIGTTDLTMHATPAVTIGAVFAVVLVGTLVLIFVIQWMTVPRVPPLPASAPVVRTHRDQVLRWIPRVLIALLILGGLGLALPDPASTMALVVGGLALYLALIMLPTAYYAGRGIDRSISALEFDPWLHWTYTPVEWAAWVEARTARMRAMPLRFTWRHDWPTVAWIMAAGIAAVCYYTSGPWQGRALYAAGICAFLALIVAWSTRSQRHEPDAKRVALLKAAPEAWLGTEGLLTDGVFASWISTNDYLLRASIDERPPRSLVFHFNSIVPSSGGVSTVAVGQLVLIPTEPADQVARELAMLQQRLTARCPSAVVTISA